jgi:hypothetical protein
MKRKIICIGIIGMFLITGLLTASAEKTILVNENKSLGKADVAFGLEKGCYYFLGYLIPKIFTQKMNISSDTVKIFNRGKISVLTVESKEAANINDIKLYVNGVESKTEPLKQGPYSSIYGKYYVWAFFLDEFLGVRWKWATYDISYAAYDESANIVSNDSLNLELFVLRNI